jgi:hypothetical protein
LKNKINEENDKKKIAIKKIKTKFEVKKIEER